MRILHTLLLSAGLALSMAPAAFAEENVSMITVTGEGIVQARPDMATISLGVTTTAETATEAMATNSAAMAAVMERLRAAGVEERDLQTSNLSLNPNWGSSISSKGGSEIDGYVATNMLSVRVRVLDNLGAVLDAVITDGANTLNGITFGLMEPRPAVDAARKQAVADARARAELLVTAAGATLGKVVSISEAGGYVSPEPMFQQESKAAGDVPFAGGEIGMSASVTIVYEIAQ